MVRRLDGAGDGVDGTACIHVRLLREWLFWHRLTHLCVFSVFPQTLADFVYE